MGGGGGGGHYVGPWDQGMQDKINKAQEKERQRLDGDVNALLNDLLSSFNDRDTEGVKRKLGELESILGDTIEIDRILFGGSVAKRTDIDGISDVDALAVLNRSDLQDKSPREILDTFYDILHDSLPRADVESITRGDLAITVKYKDNTEIQLLPALPTRGTYSIASSDGKNWNLTRPKIFQRELTTANGKMNNALIPAIKLFKAINSEFPRQKQLNGYHIETLAVDAVKHYKGPKTSKSLLMHLLDHASARVLSPIQDTTGQSGTVDAYLGKARSIERRNISQTLIAMKRRLDSATTVSQWKSVFGA